MTELHRTFSLIDETGKEWNCTVTPPESLADFQAANAGMQCAVAHDEEPGVEDWVRYVSGGASREEKLERLKEVPDVLMPAARAELARIYAKR
jgi:hypothetical protein